LLFSGGYEEIFNSGTTTYAAIDSALAALASSRRDCLVLGEAPNGTSPSQVQ